MSEILLHQPGLLYPREIVALDLDVINQRPIRLRARQSRNAQRVDVVYHADSNVQFAPNPNGDLVEYRVRPR